MANEALRHDRYYDYEDLAAALHDLARRYPDLATLRSIGRSHEGREIWLLEVTNRATGAATDKVGFYLDGHIHAEEHVTSSVVLLAATELLNGYGVDPLVTRLVDEQVFYLFPRLNPDGAERALQPPYHRWVGNGRYAPGDEVVGDLVPDDLDGDGYVAWMRVPDPRGEWAVDAEDPRVLVRRRPDQLEGTFYRLYPEGRLRTGTGSHVALGRPRDGNLNRNFPIGWQPEHVQYGAGETPLSEPETAALVTWILATPNIAGMCTYHSHGGVMLRPSMTRPDADMSPRDLALYTSIGAIATELTGYPLISVFEEFTPDKARPRRGGFEDLVYETLGIPCFGPELWDVERAAGATKAAHYGLHARDDATARRVVAWVAEHVGDAGFRPWTRVDHPELGSVEVGGLVDIWSYRNPPPHLIEDVCRPHVRFNLAHAAAAPRLRVDRLDAVHLGHGFYRVEAAVANHGYLPTNLSDVAIENGQADPVHVVLELEGGEVVHGLPEADVGHLAGRSERTMPWSPFGPEWSADVAATSWVVRARPGESLHLKVIARSARAGRHTLEARCDEHIGT